MFHLSFEVCSQLDLKFRGHRLKSLSDHKLKLFLNRLLFDSLVMLTEYPTSLHAMAAEIYNPFTTRSLPLTSKIVWR